MPRKGGAETDGRHSQFKNIMYRKGAQDERRGRCSPRSSGNSPPRPARVCPTRRPTRACGSCPIGPSSQYAEGHRRADNSARLRWEGAEAYDEVRYEGYGPGGVAVIIEALTDNRNRTASGPRRLYQSGRHARRDQQCQLHVRAHRRNNTIRRRRRAPTTCSRPSSRRARRMSRAMPSSTWWPVRPRISTPCAMPWSVIRTGGHGAPGVAPEDNGTDRRGDRNDAVQAARDADDSDDVQNVYANFEVAEDVMARLGA